MGDRNERRGWGRHPPKPGTARGSAPCQGVETSPGGAGQRAPRPAPRGRVPAPAATGLCSPWAGEGGWRRNPEHPHSRRAGEGMRRSPPVPHGQTVLRRGPAKSNGGGRRRRMREGEAPAASNTSWKDATSVFAGASLAPGTGSLPVCRSACGKHPRPKQTEGAGCGCSGFYLGGPQVCTRGQALGTPLHRASFTSHPREIYPSRGVLRPYISLPLW